MVIRTVAIMIVIIMIMFPAPTATRDGAALDGAWRPLAEGHAAPRESCWAARRGVHHEHQDCHDHHDLQIIIVVILTPVRPRCGC